MKRITGIIILSMLLAACDKLGSDSYLTEFPAVVADFTLKSSLSPETGAFSWEEGDRIKVYNGEDEAVFSYDPDKGRFITDKNHFEKTGEYQAVYPADIADVVDGSFVLHLPASRNAGTSLVDKVPLFLWKVRDGLFKFRSVCGVAKLQLVGSGVALYESSLTKVEFISTGGFVSGDGRLGKDGSLSMESGSRTLTVDCPEGMSVGSPVYLVLPAQKYPMGSKARFHFSDGKILESETSMGIVPRSGMIKSYEIEITADFFGPLEDFEDGGSLDDKY